MILVLNFKTYLRKTKDYFNLINKLPQNKNPQKELWLALNPYFYLLLKQKNKRNDIKLGLQNLGPISNKPQTGEIIYDFELINKAHFVLLGHSERYRLGENHQIIKNKIKTLQNKNIKLLIFFSDNSYNPNEQLSKIIYPIKKNLDNFISVIETKNYKKIYFVYEPWWAISSENGKIPSKEFLLSFLNWYRRKYNFPILYGGSYNSKIANLYQNLNFDGFVLGKSATKIKEIIKVFYSE